MELFFALNQKKLCCICFEFIVSYYFPFVSKFFNLDNHFFQCLLFFNLVFNTQTFFFFFCSVQNFCLVFIVNPVFSYVFIKFVNFLSLARFFPVNRLLCVVSKLRQLEGFISVQSGPLVTLRILLKQYFSEPGLIFHLYHYVLQYLRSIVTASTYHHGNFQLSID